MTIEIHEPELEALIRERMQTGHFRTEEDLLLDALLHSFDATPSVASSSRRPSIAEVIAAGRGLGEGVDFSRNPSTGRPVEL